MAYVENQQTTIKVPGEAGELNVVNGKIASYKANLDTIQPNTFVELTEKDTSTFKIAGAFAVASAFPITFTIQLGNGTFIQAHSGSSAEVTAFDIDPKTAAQIRAAPTLSFSYGSNMTILDMFPVSDNYFVMLSYSSSYSTYILTTLFSLVNGTLTRLTSTSTSYRAWTTSTMGAIKGCQIEPNGFVVYGNYATSRMQACKCTFTSSGSITTGSALSFTSNEDVAMKRDFYDIAYIGTYASSNVTRIVAIYMYGSTKYGKVLYATVGSTTLSVGTARSLATGNSVNKTIALSTMGTNRFLYTDGNGYSDVGGQVFVMTCSNTAHTVDLSPASSVSLSGYIANTSACGTIPIAATIQCFCSSTSPEKGTTAQITLVNVSATSSTVSRKQILSIDNIEVGESDSSKIFSIGNNRWVAFFGRTNSSTTLPYMSVQYVIAPETETVVQPSSSFDKIDGVTQEKISTSPAGKVWVLDKSWEPDMPSIYEQISAAADAGTAQSRFPIGTLIDVTTGKIVEDDANGRLILKICGYAGEIEDDGVIKTNRPQLLSTRAIDDNTYQFNTDTDNDGTYTRWDTCPLRDMLNNTWLKSLPSEFKESIKTSVVKTTIYGGSVITTNDKIWLPSCYEMNCGSSPQDYGDDGTPMSKAFPDANSRIGYNNSGKSTVNWWARSACLWDGTKTYRINANGGRTGYGANLYHSIRIACNL